MSLNEKELKILLTVQEDGDIMIATEVEMPIPAVLGILSLAEAKLLSRYYGAIFEEKQRLAQRQPQIVVPDIQFSNKK